MTPTVTDAHVALLRSLLSHDADDHEKLYAALGTDDQMPFAALVAYALDVVARRHFRDGYSHGDVVRYVAKIRTSEDLGDLGVRPLLAEKLLRRALGEQVSVSADPEAVALGHWALLFALTSDGSGGVDVESALADARVLADEALAGSLGSVDREV